MIVLLIVLIVKQINQNRVIYVQIVKDVVVEIRSL